MEFFSARLAVRVSELVSVLNMVFFSPRTEAIVTEAFGLTVQEFAVPACRVQVTDVVLEA